ncbi:Tyrosine recombinase XerD [Fusobacterium sp. DD29]|uniref:tyrosine-type recombinase/integrase n=1 Tax=unclassified Fusobacterium TaxID=2648384 RepID=UPI001B8AC755|nr:MULTISPECIES: tyrosine-type recombinase/integrase [unclassified Fusobacterium]MBR8700631.1 Tyrosine recombinase XerD [Fusobacterium sp. DD45]MBR8710413.1 Tyrosine recombinase XerD [Fusobacterium sp. DD28]MBR8749066.1 Tyrosine recombinase XerD [Fusobacterium sp. DD29]MBR8750953.1 Tyrosine recombinase XerD [Fusobacterium sp. DD26]MBR8761332.1 Tyrosine recombinase XerD [Fusobacterium sp. DD25]
MENENFEKNIREYLYFAEFGENKSQNTILSLKKDLFQFSKYLLEIEKTESAKEVSSVMIRGFILFLQENGNSKRTINRKLSSLRSFFKYLVRNNIVYQNPAEIVASPSFSVEKPDVLTIEEINSLREVISLKTANGIRDRLMLELLYSSGITTVELLSVGEGVFDLDKRELYVTNGKNNRIVFFSERVRKYFKDYVEAKKKKYKEKYNPDILFVNGSGNRLSDRSLRRIIDRYAKKAGIEREISPYSFRHTFAVHMLSHGMDVLYVKELMGHVNIESTKLYEQMISGVTLNL